MTTVRCKRCGMVCDIDMPEYVTEAFASQGKEFPWLCSSCFDSAEAEREEKERQSDYDEQVVLDEEVIRAGVRPAYAVRQPLVPFVADWLLRHRGRNIVLSGETGTGKSTSAGYMVRELLRDHNTVGCYYFVELLDKWREVRCDHDNPYAIKDMFRAIEEDDYVFIDECAGKNVNSDSSREFMYRLLEDVNNGIFQGKLILLGNFYTGAVKEIFGDEAPSMRRIRENFVCGRIDPVKQKINPIFR